jgi:hypothetical protein
MEVNMGPGNTQDEIILFINSFMVLGMEHRASSVLNKCSPTDLVLMGEIKYIREE